MEVLSETDFKHERSFPGCRREMVGAGGWGGGVWVGGRLMDTSRHWQFSSAEVSVRRRTGSGGGVEGVGVKDTSMVRMHGRRWMKTTYVLHNLLFEWTAGVGKPSALPIHADDFLLWSLAWCLWNVLEPNGSVIMFTRVKLLKSEMTEKQAGVQGVPRPWSGAGGLSENECKHF